MEDADIYFVERNADPRDPRVLGRTTVVNPRARPGYIPPATVERVRYGGPASFAGPAYTAPPMMTAPTPMYSQGFFGGQSPVYVQPPMWNWGVPGTLGGLFGGLNNVNIGTLIDLVGQGFAAVRSLPTPPTASGDGSTDVANLTLYQTALAEHAKTDEQIRTAVHIIGKLLGGA
jgi:hypothetical protein